METKEKTTAKQGQGIVYVLTNRYMPGIDKIGMTERSQIDERLKELYTTGVPEQFECEYACYVNKADCNKIEKALHKAFAPQRINVNREFFSITPEQAIAVLELFQQKDATAEVSQEIEDSLTPEDKEARKMRPSLHFLDMGLHIGDTLVFKADENETCTIINQTRVLYKGKNESLTSITTTLLGKNYNVQPTPYWKTKEGRDLTDIYNETYPK